MEEIHKIISNLSQGQLQHYSTISWLLNPMGNRCTGRTHLMALAFIEHSLKHKIWVKIFDHSFDKKEMVKMINKILKDIPSLRYKITTFSGELKVEKK